MADIKVGSIVVSTLQPVWGNGKVLCISGNHASVGFPALRQGADNGLRKLTLVGNVLQLSADQAVQIDGFPTSFDANCHQLNTQATRRLQRVSLLCRRSPRSGLERVCC